jgi:hypothetical protein
MVGALFFRKNPGSKPFAKPLPPVPPSGGGGIRKPQPKRQRSLTHLSTIPEGSVTVSFLNNETPKTGSADSSPPLTVNTSASSSPVATNSAVASPTDIISSASATLNESVSALPDTRKQDASPPSTSNQKFGWSTASWPAKAAIIGASFIGSGLLAAIGVLGNGVAEAKQEKKERFQKMTDIAASVAQSRKKFNALTEENNKLQAEINHLRRL